MMRTATKMSLVVILWCTTKATWSQWTSVDVAKVLGLSSPGEEVVEVRVWLGGGLNQVYDLYRIVKNSSGVSVERYVWSEVTHAAAGQFSSKEASRETMGTRRFLRKYHCG